MYDEVKFNFEIINPLTGEEKRAWFGYQYEEINIVGDQTINKAFPVTLTWSSNEY